MSKSFSLPVSLRYPSDQTFRLSVAVQNSAWMDALEPGDVVTRQLTDQGTAERARVARVTKALIILDDGKRYVKSEGWISAYCP